MTRTAAYSAGKSRPRISFIRSCALIATFGGGTAVVAAMLASPAHHQATSASRPAPVAARAVTAPQPSHVASKQARVHSVLAALAVPHPSARPASVQTTVKSDRVMAMLAAIPRPAQPTSPMLLTRMAALDASVASSFVAPVSAPLAELAEMATLAADEPLVVASLSPAESAPIAAAVEDHVEIQLPEPKPQSAVAALTQAIEDAVIPRPSARPDREPPVAPRRRGLPSPNVLAYARPDAGMEEPEAVEPAPGPIQGLSRGVAIYDISAATVYLPNGEKLEAHSGLGKMRDDPRQVHQKNRGPTPPHTYDLTMRESLFHGVQAIRLNPIGGQGKIHNRDGLLAHTYMLGKGGDSNGCVSFKDYKRFLAAFKRGDVKRLVVVSSMRSSRLAKPKSLIASLFGSKA